ncbi:MAG: hypothetical protein NVSMB18_04110 [Acetobacteraceae bacterium]
MLQFQTVVDFEDPTTDVFLVVRGSLRVVIRTGNGEHTHILGDFGADDLVGEMSAIDNVRRSARIEALVRTQLCAIPAADFLETVLASSDICMRLMRLLTARIRGQNQRLLEFVALPARLRVAAELLRLSRLKPDGTRMISPPPTHEDLADRVGTRRETVSRELSYLAEQGLIRRIRAAVIIQQPSTLQDAIDAGFNDAPRRPPAQQRQCG